MHPGWQHRWLSRRARLMLGGAWAATRPACREGRGRPFGPRSRWWAASVIALTGTLSTAGAFGLVVVGHLLPSAFVSIGVVAPCGLWLGHIREGAVERRNPYRDVSTLWLTWLLGR